MEKEINNASKYLKYNILFNEQLIKNDSLIDYIIEN